MGALSTGAPCVFSVQPAVPEARKRSTKEITMITVAARTLTFLVAVACAGLMLLALSGSAAADAGQTTCDFDGDGRNDLAVGVPGEDYGKGAVNLQYHDDGFLNDP